MSFRIDDQMVHESLETRQFGFIHPVWFQAKQPDKADYQKRPKREKKHRDSVVAGLLICDGRSLNPPFVLSITQEEELFLHKHILYHV